MSDLERDVRAALDAQASAAPPPHEGSQAVARAQRRQRITIATGVLGVAAAVVLSIVAARAIRTVDGVAPATPAPTTSPILSPPPVVPEPAQLEHGGTVWGVYLAIDENFTGPALEAARARADTLGYTAGGGEIGCDDPAAQELGVPLHSYAVAIYFDTQRDAETAAALFDIPPVGIVKVTTFCLD